MPQTTAADWKYALVVKCSASTINFGGNDVKVSKSAIGLVAVFFDLIIVFSFWCSMLALKQLQETAEREISAGTVLPQDFAVVLTQNPHSEKMEDLPPVFYAWAENVNAREEVDDLIDPTTGVVDENQNNVWNVDFGLTNLEYFKYFEAIGKLLV